jgi:hypothetical protein
VGGFECPLVHASAHDIESVPRIPADARTRVTEAAVEEANLAPTCVCSPSRVNLPQAQGDPMLDEASLCTPQKAIYADSFRPHSINLRPRAERCSTATWGMAWLGQHMIMSLNCCEDALCIFFYWATGWTEIPIRGP